MISDWPEFYHDVFPKGILGDMLESISNPRKHRWNRYLRACKAIPKDSPLSGSTTFQAINNRRHALISEAFKGKRDGSSLDTNAEYEALGKAVSAWLCGPDVAINFLLRRKLHRLRNSHPPKD